ncbi:MAG TPA: helix-turn-helix domain-containing protein [Pedobacter sp.]|jgi:excisionase family DNA binding protein
MQLIYLTDEDLRQIIRQEIGGVKPSEPKPEPKLTGQKELCAFLNLSEPTIIRWRQKGKIPYLQIGSAIRYDLNAVVSALEVGNKKKSN